MSDERIAKLEARVEQLERILAGIGAVFGGGDDAADDAELDGKYGDPVIKKDPTDRFWTGDAFAGRKLSECPPAYLDAFAKYKDLCAKLKEKDGGEAKKKYAEYDRTDARRARGWARRIRAGWTPPPPPPRPSFGGANGPPTGMSQDTGGGFGSRFGGGGTFGKSTGQPSPPPSEPDRPMGDDDFDFGHNTGCRETSTTEEHDDDPPM